MTSSGSKKVASAAIKMALTESREEEKDLKKVYQDQGIRTAAVDYGGEFLSSVSKVIERAVVAAKREGVIKDTHSDEGAVAGATHEALSQIMPKSIGLNIGGKIGIARQHDHVSVAVFFGIGMIHLDEVAVGLAHRAVSEGR
ncbi:HutP family protein [Candidatus Formimonas warabiya]|uniref:Hut operon positive regulatory protein n=1 Tax=Formimonas warabiya TaxID=1761012 RepID=A0A3G1KNR0_FORW1|nr:HutP family protein [Candidatus Formimonas warabiya]ATW24098.1 hut operon positive regulator HutP [Candidatus Formimonas warabiya]